MGVRLGLRGANRHRRRQREKNAKSWVLLKRLQLPIEMPKRESVVVGVVHAAPGRVAEPKRERLDQRVQLAVAKGHFGHCQRFGPTGIAHAYWEQQCLPRQRAATVRNRVARDTRRFCARHEDSTARQRVRR